MKRRAQTEVIGLIVIVILLVIGIFFMISQRLKPRESNQASFIDPKIAQSFLNSLKETKTAQNMVMSDIIKNCYSSNKRDVCLGGDCCAYAHETMKNALEATLGEWQRSYRLTVTRKNSDNLIDDIATPDCGRFSEKEQPGFVYIPPPPSIVLRLDICKN